MQPGTPSNNVTLPSLQQIAERWLAITIKRHQDALARLKINSTFNLSQSIKGSAHSAGNSIRIVMTYLSYGQYVDMGVGRGVAVGARKTAAFNKYRNKKGQLLRYKRKARPWYSKVIGREQVILMSIAANNIYERTGQVILQIPRRVEL